MNNGKKVGIFIMIVLIVSICVSAYVGYMENTNEQVVQTFNKDNLNLDSNTTPEVINVNINSISGLYGINFTNTDDICSINSTRTNDNSEYVNVTSSQNGSDLNINIDSNNDENVVILSNKYKYNINCKGMVGGFNVQVPTNANIESLNTVVGIGGVYVTLGGGVLNNFENQITIGGLILNGTANGLVNMNSSIALGGFQTHLNDPMNLHSDIQFGGSQFNKVETNNTTIDYQDADYNSAVNRLNISSNIQIGGFYTD